MWRSWTTKLASLGRTPTPAKTCNSASTRWRQKKSSNGIRRASSFITCRTTNARKRRATPSRSPKRKPPSKKPPPTSAPEISPPSPASRSEEHTSELQSPDHLVCRLLLEKKKNLPSQHDTPHARCAHGQ